MPGLALDAIRRSYGRARLRRQPWEPLWRECYAYALPQRGYGLGAEFGQARRYNETLFDGTAPDAVDQLAASLLAELTPPWSRWFGLRPGHEVPAAERPALAAFLKDAAERVQGHFARSNFAVEIHQCFLDLVTIGTATLLFQEAPIGETSAFRFAAIPAAEMFVDGDQNGHIRHYFRASALSVTQMRSRFPDAVLPARLLDEAVSCAEPRIEVVEAVCHSGEGYRYLAFLAEAEEGEDGLLAEGQFEQPRFITFRWVKGAGELYGRSPVMTALPDIKTANKVVELILKNASIAVTGHLARRRRRGAEPGQHQADPGQHHPEGGGLRRS